MERDRRVSPLIPVGATPSGALREGLRIITIDISEIAAFSKRQVHPRKKVSREWGVGFSRSQTDYSEIKRKVSKEENWRKLQGILNGLSGNSIRGYIDSHREKGQDLFESLGVIAREAEFNDFRQVKILYRALRRLGIPGKRIRTGNYTHKKAKGRSYPQYYYVVFAKHRDVIKEVLSDNPSLQRFKGNPVRQAYGPENNDIPNTTRLRKKEEFLSVKTALDSLGIKPQVPTISYESLLSVGCPVSIFTDTHGFYYPVENEEAFKAFLQEKLKVAV